MRTRAKSLYTHLMEKEIFSLPHPDTLHSYVKRLGSAYGFKHATFDLLEEKWEEFEESELRGAPVFFHSYFILFLLLTIVFFRCQYIV